MNAQLRELSVEGFEEVLGRVAGPLLTLLRRAAVIDGALRKVLSGAAAGSAEGGGNDGLDGSESAAAYSERVEKQSAGMVQRVCELAHDRYARLLKTRKEVHARLPLMDFVRMSKSVVEFVHDVQHLSGQPYDALSSELQSHAQAFLQTTHEASMHKLEAIVEIEQWKQARFAALCGTVTALLWGASVCLPACLCPSPHTLCEPQHRMSFPGLPLLLVPCRWTWLPSSRRSSTPSPVTRCLRSRRASSCACANKSHSTLLRPLRSCSSTGLDLR